MHQLRPVLLHPCLHTCKNEQRWGLRRTAYSKGTYSHTYMDLFNTEARAGSSVFVEFSCSNPHLPFHACLAIQPRLLFIFQLANDWTPVHFLRAGLVQRVPGHRRKAQGGGVEETANQSQMPGQNPRCDSAEQSTRTKTCHLLRPIGRKDFNQMLGWRWRWT